MYFLTGGMILKMLRMSNAKILKRNLENNNQNGEAKRKCIFEFHIEFFYDAKVLIFEVYNDRIFKLINLICL